VWYPPPAPDLWGFTASDGTITATCRGKTYVDFGFPPDNGRNNGAVAPTALGGAMVFAPQAALETLRSMYERYHDRLWGLYGLKDSLNATCDPSWIDNDYFGIDVGIMVAMIENYRSGLIWKAFMRNPGMTDALDRAGFVAGSRNPPISTTVRPKGTTRSRVYPASTASSSKIMARPGAKRRCRSDLTPATPRPIP
jgi:hypothetical protein